MSAADQPMRGSVTKKPKPKQYITARATMFGCDGFKILVTGNGCTMKVDKRDGVRLANVCLAAHASGKLALVNVKWLNKQLSELKTLRAQAQQLQPDLDQIGLIVDRIRKSK